ncbi:hypothetical protein LJR039_004054 [Pseudorhodoferax sp. LjRoot39]|uniref:hypothetical protein n=1 Tax=Pseudorhodoferax sp. LjRoot39 TaxID=3342328 RepID=UPI003ECD4DF6
MNITASFKAAWRWLDRKVRLSTRWKWAVRHSCKKCILFGVLFPVAFIVLWALVWIIIGPHGDAGSRSGEGAKHQLNFISARVGISLIVIISAIYFVSIMAAAARVDQSQTNMLVCLFGFAFFLTLTLGVYAVTSGDLVAGVFSDAPVGRLLKFLVTEVLNLKASFGIAVAPFFLLVAPQLLSFAILGPMGYATPLRLGRGIVKFMLGAITKGLLTCAAVVLAVQLLVVSNDWPGSQASSTMGVIGVAALMMVGAAAICWVWAEVNAGLATSELGAVTACVGRNSRRRKILNGNAKLENSASVMTSSKPEPLI